MNFYITADSRNEYAPGILQPELCGYDASRAPLFEGSDSDEKPLRFGRCLGFAELFALVRNGGDPFSDTHFHDRNSKSIHKSFFASENHRYREQYEFDTGREEKRNLGRAVGYVSIAFSRQFRAFYFSILFFGTRARFMRWDRSGGIVTASFDYRRQPEPLCEFLWRFHHANPVQRGYDPTVTVASHSEEALFRACVRRHAAIQLGFRETHSEELDEALRLHYESGKVMRMQVYDQCRRSFRAYLVSVPLSSPQSADGRSTRAYWAVESKGSHEGEVRFLKDVWRMDVGSVRQEGIAYGEMEEGGVTNICDLEASGDIRGGYGTTSDSREVRTFVRGTGTEYLHVKLLFQESIIVDAQIPVAGGNNRSEKAPPTSRKHLARIYSQQRSKTSSETVQCTRTNDYTDAPWVCDCLRDRLYLRVYKHTHYRVVLRQAGYPLKTFSGSREFFVGIKDALDGKFC